MVVLDTNIIIDHLRQKLGIITHLRAIARETDKSNLAISTISIQELYVGRSTKVHEKEQLLLSTIVPLTTLSYSYEIAQLAGEIMRDKKQLMGFADAAIAATAIVNNASLATLNKKDFSAIAELELYKF